MTNNEFLEKLRLQTGGKVIKEDSVGGLTDTILRPFSRLYADYKKHYIKVDFIDSAEILLEISVTTPHRMLLRPENIISKLLDKVNLSPEVKIGDPEFDAAYVIQNTDEQHAKKTINERFKQLISSLTPFLSFEMTDREFKLVKSVDITGIYTTEKAFSDINILVELVEATKGI